MVILYVISEKVHFHPVDAPAASIAVCTAEASSIALYDPGARVTVLNVGWISVCDIVNVLFNVVIR